MAYQAFRTNGFPTYYDELHTPWRADILEAGLIFAFCITAASFYVILPGIRGKEKIYTFIRVTLSLFIGGVIICTNWSYTWETAEIHTRTKYKAGTGEEISADIGLHIGLRGINITLKGTPENQLNETINYNEHFSWEWEQGRIGFGPFAGRFNQEYRAAQFRGLPLPILWIAEYFTFDGEGIRWGRHYRQAGWFSHIMLWLCFPLWVLTNIMFFILLRYGAYFLALTGGCMVIANIIWATIRNPTELAIPWEEGKMTVTYGGSFYVCLITGILCVIAAVVIRFLDLRFPTLVVSFFGADVLQDADDVLPGEALKKAEDEDGGYSNHKDLKRPPADDVEMRAMDGGSSSEPTAATGPIMPPAASRLPPPEIPAPSPQTSDFEEEDIYEPAPAPAASKYLKRKSRGLTMRFQKSRRRRPPPPPPSCEVGGDELYVNEGYGAEPEDVRVDMH